MRRSFALNLICEHKWSALEKNNSPLNMQHFSLAYHSVYVRNWRVLGAIWVLFALCTTVMQVVVLIHPSWIGNDDGGYFGLYDYCNSSECTWQLFRIRPLGFSFELAAFLVLTATILSVIAVFSILLLVLLRDHYVFLLCSWLHLFSFATMMAGCLIYPSGWENPRVREICESRKYNLGICTIRWPYLLALVIVVDQLAVSLLGFILACRQPPNIPELANLAEQCKQPLPAKRKISCQGPLPSKSSIYHVEL